MFTAAAVFLGGIAFLVAASLHDGFAVIIGLSSLVMLALSVLGWPVIRRRGRLFVGAGVAGALYLQLILLCVGLAAMASLIAAPGALLAGGVAVVAATWRLRTALPLWEAEWEAKRVYIEREVLDLQAGTYDLSRPLNIGPVGRRGTAENGGTVVRSPDHAAAVAGRVAPIVAVSASFGAVAAGNGLGDLRVLALAVLAPLLTVLLTSMLAPSVLIYRRLAEYERRIGRPLLIK